MMKLHYLQLWSDFHKRCISVTENTSIDIMARLDVAPERRVSIPLTATPSSELTEADYTIPSTIVFNSNDIIATVTITVVNNTAGQSLAVGFENLPDMVTLGSITNTVISIIEASTAIEIPAELMANTMTPAPTENGDRISLAAHNFSGVATNQGQLIVSNGLRELGCLEPPTFISAFKV